MPHLNVWEQRLGDRSFLSNIKQVDGGETEEDSHKDNDLLLPPGQP